MILFNKKQLERFRYFLTQKIDFESQNFAIFDNVYSTEHKTQKLFIGWVIGLEHKRRPCKMCDSVQQKLVHTKGYISTNMVRRKDDVYFNEDYDPNYPQNYKTNIQQWSSYVDKYK